MPRILHVGLRPIAGTAHYPVIQVVRVPLVPWQEAFERSSHILFTSQTAVELFSELEKPLHKPVGIAVGKKTFEYAKKFGFSMQYAAQEETQEGVRAILEMLDVGMLFWPRSCKAREGILDCCKRFELPLYDVVGQCLEPKPLLEAFDEVYFTSPSQVEAFFAIFPTIPKGLRFRTIGPITALALQRKMG